MATCKPVSDIVSTQEASALGDQIEAMVRAHYCASKGGCQFFPAGTQDFADSREGVPTVTRFIAFLKANNPSVDEVLLATQFSTTGGNKVPDLMIDAPGRREFYEVKPNSSSGVSAGEDKNLALEAFFGINGLGYVPGVVYQPDQMITLYVTTSGFLQVTVSLHFFSLQPGLIVYEVCTETKLRVPSVNPKVINALNQALMELAAALLILALLPVVVVA